MEESAIDTGSGAGAKWRAVDSSRGTVWLTEAWALFMKNPGMWVIFGLIFMVGMVFLGFIPMIGGLISALLTQVIIGGWMLCARKLETGGTLEVGDLFVGFKEKLNPLLVLGALALAATVVIVLVMVVLGGGAMMGMMAGGAARSGGGFMASAAVGMLALLVGLVLGSVFAMAFWFAPALVVFRDIAPVDALKASWSASLGNMVPFLVFGVIWIIAAVVASIPLGLGWFVLMPVTALACYRSYVDIFEG
jgi:uncharacterized membrane protein